jgi:glycolate oxidase FAD binding subunit
MGATVVPSSFADAAQALALAAQSNQPVRITGGGTKLHWGARGAAESLVLHTTGLDATLEHNPGDLMAIFQAGVPLDRLGAELAEHGQMLAIDPPPLPAGSTIGGVFATGDSGPLRHRYGQPRDLILGVTVALSDGTIAKAGGKVIKNVAGYDLAKLFTGSFGTLGLIMSLSVRLHSLPVATATAFGASDDAGRLRDGAVRLARAPLELDALDVAWHGGRGRLLARVGGREAIRRAGRGEQLMREAGLDEVGVSDDDAELWARQRAGQRSAGQAILHVAARPTQLPELIAAADRAAATLVGRAALGISYLEVEPERIDELRHRLPAGSVSTVLDLPEAHRDRISPWEEPPAPLAELMRSVKHRFDPAGICNPGVFVAGI